MQNKCKKLNDKKLRNKKENFKNANITYDDCTYLKQCAKGIGSIMQKSKNNNFNDTKFDARAARVAEANGNLPNAQLSGAKVASVSARDTLDAKGSLQNARRVDFVAAGGKKTKQCVAGGRVAHASIERKSTATICAWLFLFVACLAVTIGFGCVGNGGLKVSPANEGITAEATALFSGSGTATSPYLISSQADLTALASTTDYATYYASGVTYRCTVGSLPNWTTPIGTKAHPFGGAIGFQHDIDFGDSSSSTNYPLFGYLDGAIIDGRGNTFKNKYPTTNVEGYAGGLAYVASDTTLKNATFLNFSVSGATYSGVIFGASYGTTLIEGCNVNNSVSSGTNAGGLIGVCYDNITIKQSGIENATTTGTNYSGGLIGSAYGASVSIVDDLSEFSSVTVSAKGSNIGASEAGYGYVGYKDDNSTISGTSSTGAPTPTLSGHTISSINDLNSFATAVNGGFDFDGVTVTLTADIDGTSSPTFTTSIGTKEFPFRGTFNLNYREITITRPLFNYIESATINNGYIHGSITGTSTFTGAIANVAVNSTVQTVYANMCMLAGTQFVGSYFGYAKGSSIENCNMNDSTFKGYYAGMIGYADGINVIDGGYIRDSIFYSGVGDTASTLNGKCGAGFKASTATFKNGSGSAISTISLFNTASVNSTTITGYTGVVVTIELNGGDPDQDLSLVIPKGTGSTVSLSNVGLIKKGYQVTGYTFVSGGGSVSGLTYTYGSTNGVVKAQWALINYTITYNLDGGAFSVAAKTTYTINDAAFTLATPTKADYEFLGWTGSNGTTPQTTVTVTAGSTGNLTYTANWKSTKVNVKINVTVNNDRSYIIYMLDTDGNIKQQFVVANGTEITVNTSQSFKLLVYQSLYMVSKIDGETLREKTYTGATSNQTINIQLSGASNVNNWIVI